MVSATALPSATKQMKYNYSLKIHKADVLSTQETKLNQSHRTPNILSLHTYQIRSHSQTRRMPLTYIKNNISFSQLNTSKTFPIEPPNHQNLPFYNTAFIYRKHVHSTQLSQLEDSIIPSTLTTVTNLTNPIITADANAQSPLWYSPTEDHRELIEDILLNFNHIALNTNTPTRLPSNQIQQPTSSDVITASADLDDCTSSQTIHFLTSDLTTLIIHHKTKTTRFHFTKTITNYQKADWKSFKHVKRSAQMFMRQTKTLSRQFGMPIDSSSLKEIKTAQITLTCPCISIFISITVTIFANKTDQTHKSLLSTMI